LPILDKPAAADGSETRTSPRPPLTAKQHKVTDNLGQLLDVLPPRLRACLEREEQLDDLLEISVELRRHGTASMTIFQQARRGDTLLAEGEIRIGCVDDASFKPRRIPDQVMATLR